ncbi:HYPOTHETICAL PROTEIN MCJ_000770 [Mesomycoplasma conjunctivae]|uniref:Uncharacterized protein n=1 Tax=Mesomycoplasma conjunctivae (strain ATCC 25834 / NCTC 10147 / HRC/581) TaxID=572263 RepID=C5J5M9_MESCH|nr:HYPOTHETICAL PROTEIN MCJ_000770 [Mesomycoplasma conjunctivae]
MCKSVVFPTPDLPTIHVSLLVGISKFRFWNNILFAFLEFNVLFKLLMTITCPQLF